MHPFEDVQGYDGFTADFAACVRTAPSVHSLMRPNAVQGF
jgi:hypothetical protein